MYYIIEISPILLYTPNRQSKASVIVICNRFREDDDILNVKRWRKRRATHDDTIIDFLTCGTDFSQVWHGAAEGAKNLYLTTDKAITKSYLNSFEVFWTKSECVRQKHYLCQRKRRKEKGGSHPEGKFTSQDSKPLTINPITRGVGEFVGGTLTKPSLIVSSRWWWWVQQGWWWQSRSAQ